MLFSTLDVIDLLIWVNSLNWPLNLNLVFWALWIWMQSGFLILLFRLFIYFIYYFIVYLILFFKMSDFDRDRSVFDEIFCFRILVPYIGIIKIVSKNTEALICSEPLFLKNYWLLFMDRIYGETGHF